MAIDWHSIDTGGAIALVSDDGTIELSGTIGQPDASTLLAEADGVTIEIIGGFWRVRSDPIPCEGDANDDGLVDPLDSGFVLARFGCDVGTGDPNCDTADMNGHGLVESLDLGFVQARFG